MYMYVRACENAAALARARPAPLAPLNMKSASHSEPTITTPPATNADAGLAAGIFHRKEVEIKQVKDAVKATGIPVRISAKNC